MSTSRAAAGRAQTLPRYSGTRPLPAYAFTPGVNPHPTRAPQGHSYGRAPEPLDSAFDWGVDLYNHGYAWEAHEAWEDLWRAEEPGSAAAAFVRGLIQCAAACLKVRLGRHDAARRIGARARAHLEHASRGAAETRGLDLPEFIRRFAAWLEGGEVDGDGYPRIVLDA